MNRLISLIVFLLVAFYVLWPAYSGYQIHAALAASDPAALDRKIDFPSVRQSMREPVLTHVDQRMAGVMKDLGPATKLVGNQIPRDRIGEIIDGALLEVINPEKLVDIYANGGDLSAEIQKSVLKQINLMGGLGKLLQIAGSGSTAEAGGQEGNGDSADGGSSFGGIKLPDGLGGLLGNETVTKVVGEVAGKVGLDAGKLGAKLFPGISAAPGSTATQESGGSKSPSSLGLGNIKTFGFAGPLGLQLGVARSASAKEAEVTGQINFQDLDWKVTKITPNLGS